MFAIANHSEVSLRESFFTGTWMIIAMLHTGERVSIGLFFMFLDTLSFKRQSENSLTDCTNGVKE